MRQPIHAESLCFHPETRTAGLRGLYPLNGCTTYVAVRSSLFTGAYHPHLTRFSTPSTTTTAALEGPKPRSSRMRHHRQSRSIAEARARAGLCSKEREAEKLRELSPRARFRGENGNLSSGRTRTRDHKDRRRGSYPLHHWANLLRFGSLARSAGYQK